MSLQILLCYSRRHFDPADDGAASLKDDLRGSSAHILASRWFDALSDLGEVTYIDPTEYLSVEGRSFDLLVGHVHNFTRLLEVCSVKRSILFTVNTHPSARNKALREMVKNARLSARSFASWDLVDESDQIRAIDAADYIVGVGNAAVLNTFLDHGVPPSKIKMINYGVGTPIRRSGDGPPANRLVYCASDVGLRKGFDVVESIARALASDNIDFHLDIVGEAASPHYRRRLDGLARDLIDHVTVHGWVPASSPRYWEILAGASFLLMPAVEEGQAGAVLDAMRAEVVPIVSLATGVDFSPLGLLEVAVDSSENVDLVRRALAQAPGELARLRRKTTEYYEQFHPDPTEGLREVTEGCLNGHVHPLVSVTLPIFNKEKSIVRLLEHFDKAAQAYGNIELNVIFDGCTDRSAEVVRDFFRTRSSYPVSFRTTPNIFEVKTSNLGLQASRGKYCVLLQDDNIIYDRYLFFEATNFLDKTPTAAVLGCLAGVNFYPLGATLSGLGQIAMTENEVYWRQDADTDPALRTKFFEVDACMRGPLFIRRDFVERHGYLDEIYAPLYMDDMDLCFRARDKGSKVYCMLANVENEGLTMAHYDASKWASFDKVFKANTKVFYERWSPSETKDYLSVERVPISGGYMRKPLAARLQQSRSVWRRFRRIRYVSRVFDTQYCRELALSPNERRLSWVRDKAAAVPAEGTLVQICSGAPALEGALVPGAHLHHDISSDTNGIPLPDGHADVVVCSEVLQSAPDPLLTLADIVRVLKPGGQLVFTASQGSDRRDDAQQFYRGYTRAWYERFFPEHGLEIVSLEPNGGLYAHTAELLWRGRDEVINPLRAGSALKKLMAGVLQVLVFNLPTLVLHTVERRRLDEDFTVGFHCVARRKVEGSQPQP
jgi:glycosyltransferase involved in cell wall biosynthesis